MNSLWHPGIRLGEAGRRVAWWAGLHLGLLILGSLVLANRVAAQEMKGIPVVVETPGQQFRGEVWQTDHGLPGNKVNCVLHADDGFLWVGTDKGLARFDGVRFRAVPLPDQFARSTPVITALAQQADGRIWVGTQSGLCVLGDESSWVGPGDGLPAAVVTSLAVGGDEEVWIGTARGLALLEPGGIRTFSAADGLPQEEVRRLTLNRRGVLWVSFESGVYQRRETVFEPIRLTGDLAMGGGEPADVSEDGRDHLWVYGESYLLDLGRRQRLNFFPIGRAESLRVWSVCEDTVANDARVWVGTAGQGLLCYRYGRFESVTLEVQGALVDEVRVLQLDREGNLWVGTGGWGLIRLKGQLLELVGEEAGMPERPVTAVVRLKDASMLVGVPEVALWQRSGARGERLAFPAFPDGVPQVHSVAQDNWGWWAGTAGHGLWSFRDQEMRRYTLADGLLDNRVLAVREDRSGGVWLGLASGAVQHFNGRRFQNYGEPQGLSRHPVTGLFAMKDDTLWVGSAGGGVRRLREGARRLDVFADLPVLTNGIIRSICEDRRDRILIGTEGQGLLVYENRQWRQVGLRDGLLEEDVMGLVPEGGNLLIVGTRACYRLLSSSLNQHLQRGSPLRVERICDLEGLVKPELLGSPVAEVASDSRLWLGTWRGLAIIDLRRFIPAPAPPQTQIEGVWVDEHSSWPEAGASAGIIAVVQEQADLEVSPGFKRLEIHYTTPVLGQPERVRFKHRLLGFDADWVDADTVRKVSYGHLPPGRYEFEVISGDVDGNWNTVPARQVFVVATPFWVRSWFLAPVSVAGLFCLVGVVRFVGNRRLKARVERMEREQATERERARIARDMHDELGSQLTRLTILSRLALGDSHDGPERKEQLQDIADTSHELVRKMDEIVWAVNPANDTIEHLVDYLSQYAAEYFENTQVRCEVKVPMAPTRRPLSAEVRHHLFLAFEEALSNALRHGGSSLVSVVMTEQEDGFGICVTDNGVGFASDQAQRAGADGLLNMRRRLTELGGACEITSAPGSGTSVCFKVRLKSNGKNHHG